MSLLQAQEMLTFYMDAEKAALQGQSMTKNGRTWTRADLSEIRRGRQEWQRQVNTLSRPVMQRGPSLVEFS